MRVNALNAGSSARIHFAEDGVVSELSPTLKDEVLQTKAYRVQFLAVDPNGQFQTGDTQSWENKLVIRASWNELSREVELFVAPTAKLWYTLDGSEPRNGTPYTNPIASGAKDVTLLVYAEGGGLEQKERFTYGAVSEGKKAVVVDRSKPATLNKIVTLGSRQDAYQALSLLKERQSTLEKVQAVIGTAPQVAQFGLGDTSVSADYLENVLNQIGSCLAVDSAISLKIHRFQFKTGQDLLDLAEKAGFEIGENEFTQ